MNPSINCRKIGKVFKEVLSDKEINGKIAKMGQSVRNGNSQDASKFLIDMRDRFLEVHGPLHIVPR